MGSVGQSSDDIAYRSGPNTPGVAFITGGARGLGNAIARSFAKDGARAVVIVDILEEALQEGKQKVEALGTKCLALQADVTNEASIEKAVKDAVAEFGRIDYAANFAGVIGPSDHVAETDVKAFERCMAVNTTGVFLSTKHELRQMMTQSSIQVESGRVPQLGSIVNCASVNSLQSMQGTVAYTASKHAVHGITKAAALEARKHNIRVNAVSPGFLLTDMVKKPVIEEGGVLGKKLWQQFEERQGRSAVFEEVGDVVVLMSTPRMSLVNGQNLFIDGGFTVNEGFV